jgi:hypothetical protein
MNTPVKTLKASAAGVELNRAMLTYRRLQAEYDRTREMTPALWQAEDAFKAAYRKWEGLRGY